MSKKETPMLRRYWEQVGGILIEEFMAVKKTSECGRRLIDGVIILDAEPKKVCRQNDVSIEGKDIIVVQVKARRLGMTLMGQTLFSKRLMEKFRPLKITSVALCKEDDSVLRPLLEKHDGCKVVVI